MPTIRKIVTIVDDGFTEAGIPVDSLYRRVAVAAVISNPYAGRYSEDLSELLDFSVELADQMARRLVEAMVDPVESYGKSSLVGLNGEAEHGHALFTTPAADRLREVMKGASWLQSTGKRGAPGASIDVGLAYKDEVKVRSHYDTVTVSIPDAPEPDEIVAIIAAANRGRPNFRLGGLSVEDVKGKTGLA